MFDSLVQDIIAYIEKLKKDGYHITLHVRKAGFWSDFLTILARYNIHDTLFCQLVKTAPEAWEHCVACQERIYEKLKHGAFFGMCYAGIEEFVFPISLDDEILGFVSVSGYGVHPVEAMARMERTAKRFSLPLDDLACAYTFTVGRTLPQFDDLSCIVKPLCHMLSLLAQKNEAGRVATGDNTATYIFARAAAYINRNFSESITLELLSRHCQCSISTLERSFQNESGQTVMAYLKNKRMAQARSFLLETSLSIKSVAVMAGFSDPNYFSASFRKYYGCAPSAMRKKALHKIADPLNTTPK